MRLLFIICIITIISGCESLPLREGGLAIGKDTTARIEDLGIACINNKF